MVLDFWIAGSIAQRKMNFNTFYAQKNIFYTLKILYFKLFLVFQK